MKKYTPSALVVLVAILAIGGWLWYGKMKEKPTLPVSGQVNRSDVKQDTIQTESKTQNTSTLKTYRNDAAGFEFEYPKDWNLTEMSSPSDPSFAHPEWVFRYLSIEAPNFTVSLGIKDATKEENIQPRPWRTGIPSGDFEKRGVVTIGNGLAERRYLVYRDSQGSHIPFVWYCKPEANMNWCNNFSIGKGKVAFVEVLAKGDQYTGQGTASWDDIQKDVETVLGSIKIF